MSQVLQTPPTNQDAQVDPSLLLALQLQKQFDEEERLARLQQEEDDLAMALAMQAQDEREYNKFKKKSKYEKMELGYKEKHEDPVPQVSRALRNRQFIADPSEYDSYDPSQYYDEEDDIEDSYFDYEDLEPKDQRKPNGRVMKRDRFYHNEGFSGEQSGSSKVSIVQHIKEEFKGTHINQSVVNQLKTIEKQEGKHRIRNENDRSTTDKVIDKRTRLILFKMMNNAELNLKSLAGSLSTGKEAVVFRGKQMNGDLCAVKVFKTSILTFKDRDRYIGGEFRFRKGYDKHNPRKMVDLWSRKEFHNLMKIHKVGIPSPKPIEFKNHVIVMEFLGTKDGAAKRLKQCHFSMNRLRKLYIQIVYIMRTMYQKAKLVHSDFSEYNILYHKSTPYVIDVSQAVETTNPNALEFLRMDCDTISKFFIKRKMNRIMNIRELFEFITDMNIPDYKTDKYLDKMMEVCENREPLTLDLSSDEEVFKKVFIPRTLHQVENFDKHQTMANGGEDSDALFYRKVTGLNMDLSGVDKTPQWLQEEGEQGEQQEEELVFVGPQSGQYHDDDEEEEGEEPIDLGKHLQSLSKKERKAFMRQMKKDKREDKTPKKIKQAKRLQAQKRKGKKTSH